LFAGARFVHNETFGDKAIPGWPSVLSTARRQFFSGTRLHFSYATGIKEPRLEESFCQRPFVIPNLHLKAEEARAFEAGVQQSLLGGEYGLSATYYHNAFHNQIDFATNPTTFVGQYVNVNKSIAHVRN